MSKTSGPARALWAVGLGLGLATVVGLAPLAFAAPTNREPKVLRALPAGAKLAAETTIGMEAKLVYRVPVELGAVMARGYRAGAPMALRVADIRRVAVDGGQAGQGGEVYEFDLRFIPLKAGLYDLRDGLERVSGLPVRALPAAYVKGISLLPEDHDLSLIDSPTVAPARFGGYQMAVYMGAGAWAVPLVAWGAWRVLKRKKLVEPPPPEPTLADVLRPLIERIIAGESSVGDRARLELLLIAYWKDRLAIGGLKHFAAVERLRADPQAGALLRQTDAWLHAGRPDGQVDVAALLEPYRGVAMVNVAAGEGGAGDDDGQARATPGSSSRDKQGAQRSGKA